jgi:hypothetical protein
MSKNVREVKKATRKYFTAEKKIYNVTYFMCTTSCSSLKEIYRLREISRKTFDNSEEMNQKLIAAE